MCIARGVSTARATGTWGPGLEPGAIAISTALAERTSGLHIWCCARPPADTVLFLPLCTRWHCQLSYGEWALAGLWARGCNPPALTGHAGTPTLLPTPRASFRVVLGERPEKGIICTDPGSRVLCVSAALLMIICDFSLFIFKLLLTGESAIQLQCLTGAGCRVLVPRHPGAAGTVAVTRAWVVLILSSSGPAQGPAFGHWLSTQQEMVFAAASNPYR